MLHILNWSEFVTEDFLTVILQTAEVSTDTPPDWVSGYLSSILEAHGQLPFVEGDASSDALTQIANKLFHNALLSASTDFGFTRSRYGLYLSEEDNSFKKTAFAIKQVSANAGTLNELSALPIIGPVLAQRIIDERQKSGSFKSLEDITARVSGFGEGSAEALSDVLILESLPEQNVRLAPHDLELQPLLRRLLSRIEDNLPESRLRALLDHLTVSAQRPHPPLPRPFKPLYVDPPSEFDELPVEMVGVLSGANYYFRLQELITNATTSVLVMMFHAAFSDEGHPTKEILNTLVAAKARGLDVRVILDRDRDTDPYKSTVINTAALEFLNAQSVPCRFDSPERLLHTKLIIVDSDWSLVGSHNWSAGSYFQFDDLTFAVNSDIVASTYKERFEEAWSASE